VTGNEGDALSFSFYAFANLILELEILFPGNSIPLSYSKLIMII
jgi:hypothetical protein